MEGHRVKVHNDALRGGTGAVVEGKGEAEIIEIEEVQDTRTPAEKAEEARSTGNQFFKEKEYKKAIEAYKEAIRYDNTRAAFFANFAASWLQLLYEYRYSTRTVRTGTYVRVLYSYSTWY